MRTISSIATGHLILGLLLAGLSTVGVSESLAQGGTNRSGDVWYFGRNAGLHFEGGALPTVRTDGALNTVDGSAVATDPETGDLLFYTDGATVWNANHDVTPNGTGLLGDESSGQPAVIVPEPGSSDRFYVFTTGSRQVSDRTFRYSVVDMQEDGGRGDVILKNQPLITRGSEKVTATRHCNRRDYWVLTQEWGTNRFFAYPITAAGIGEPVISALGTSWPNGDDVQGTAQFSPDGSTLAITSTGLEQLAFFDFDPATGVLDNYRIIATGRSFYGGEFSPDQSKFYSVTLPRSGAELVQFDLILKDPKSIEESLTVLQSVTGAWQGGQLQLGPDGAIYVSFVRRSNLGRIAFPNRPGTASEYTHNAISLQSGRTGYGLPNFIDSDLPNVESNQTRPKSTLTLSTTTPRAGDEVVWHLELCNQTNRRLAEHELRFDLPASFKYLSGLPSFPLYTAPTLEPGECIVLRVSTKVRTNETAGTLLTGCVVEADSSESLCAVAIQLCASLTVQDTLFVDPCPTPHPIFLSSDSIHVEGTEEEARVPIYFEGLEEGVAGPDQFTLTIEANPDASLLLTDDLDRFVEGSATEGWDVRLLSTSPGKILLRFRRLDSSPLTEEGGVLAYIPLMLYMPRSNFSAGSDLEITIETIDRCFTFVPTTGHAFLEVCGLDSRRIQILTGGKLWLGPPLIPTNSDRSTAQFAVPIDCQVKLTLHDMRGTRIADLLDKHLSQGEYSLDFRSTSLPSGTYIMRLTTEPWTTSVLFNIGR